MTQIFAGHQNYKELLTDITDGIYRFGEDEDLDQLVKILQTNNLEVRSITRPNPNNNNFYTARKLLVNQRKCRVYISKTDPKPKPKLTKSPYYVFSICLTAPEDFFILYRQPENRIWIIPKLVFSEALKKGKNNTQVSIPVSEEIYSKNKFQIFEGNFQILNKSHSELNNLSEKTKVRSFKVGKTYNCKELKKVAIKKTIEQAKKEAEKYLSDEQIRQIFKGANLNIGDRNLNTLVREVQYKIALAKAKTVDVAPVPVTPSTSPTPAPKTAPKETMPTTEPTTELLTLAQKMRKIVNQKLSEADQVIYQGIISEIQSAAENGHDKYLVKNENEEQLNRIIELGEKDGFQITRVGEDKDRVEFNW